MELTKNKKLSKSEVWFHPYQELFVKLPVLDMEFFLFFENDKIFEFCRLNKFEKEYIDKGLYSFL